MHMAQCFVRVILATGLLAVVAGNGYSASDSEALYGNQFRGPNGQGVIKESAVPL